jgi:hypothetical protein
MRTVGTVGALALVLVAAQVAHAALAETPISRFTAADQAAAKAAVLRSADLGAGWKGGLKKSPKVSGVTSEDECPGLWEPKQSDLVITGLAESKFTAPGAEISSTVQVYKTVRMSKLDWQRTVVHPGVIPCLRRKLAPESEPGFRFVSLTRTPFPQIAGNAAVRFRIVFEVTPDAGGDPVRVLTDGVVFGKGRTGISLSFTLPDGARAATHAAEVRLARLLAGRIKA